MNAACCRIRMALEGRGRRPLAAHLNIKYYILYVKVGSVCPIPMGAQAPPKKGKQINENLIISYTSTICNERSYIHLVLSASALNGAYNTVAL